MKKIYIGVALILLVGAALWAYRMKGQDRNAPASVSVGESTVEFSIQKKSAHFETSTPSHGDLLAAAPLAIVVNVNFDLGPGTHIQITHAGKEYGV